jgi:Predicted pPIWI-associating nuclease
VSVDSLASHFSLEDISLATLRVADIDHERILFEAQGVVHCILQFGSNSDLRRGDGAELPQSFKFRSELYSSVESPDDIEVDENSLGVDTSEWERMRYGLDEREDY